jgi:hypothetical protein
MPRKSSNEGKVTGNPALATTMAPRTHRHPPKETGQVVVQ